MIESTPPKKTANPFARNLFALLASQAALGVCSALGIALATRLLGPAEYGKYALFLSVTSLFVALSVSWARTGSFRFLAKAHADGRPLGPTLANALLLGISLLAIDGLILFFAGDYILTSLSLSGDSMWLVLLYIGVFDLFTQVQYLYRASERFRAFSLIPVLERGIFLLGLAILLLYQTTGKTLIDHRSVIFLLIASNLVLCLVAAIRFPRHHLGSFRPDLSELRPILTFALPFILTNGLLYISTWSDVFFIEHFLTTEKVGLYYLGSQFQNISGQSIATLNTLLIPVFLRSQKALSEDRTQFFYERVLPLLLLAACALLLLGNLALRLLIPLAFSTAYQDSLPIVLGLLLSSYAWLTYMVLQPFFFARGHSKTILWIMLAATVLSLPLYIWWLPRFELTGAVWARNAAAILMALFGLKALTRKISLSSSILFGTFLFGLIPLAGAAMVQSERAAMSVTLLGLLGCLLWVRNYRLCTTSDIETLREIGIPTWASPIFRLVSRLAHRGGVR